MSTSDMTALLRVIRQGIDRVITDAVEATNPDAFIDRPAFPGAKTAFRVPDPLVALAPAILAQRRAGRAARELAARARADGATWQQIAVAAGIRPDLPESERGFHAWLWASGEPHEENHGVSVGWRCPSCHLYVADFGPDGGHPADAERGHDSGCARQLVDIYHYSRAHGHAWGGAA